MNTLPFLPLMLARVPPGLRQALGQSGVPCVELAKGWHAQNMELTGVDTSNLFALRIHGPTVPPRFVIFDSRIASAPPIITGQELIDVDCLRHGEASDPFDALLDERATPRAWEVGPFQAVEEVALVDKRAVRLRMIARLQNEIERRGGVWVTLAAYPHPFHSAFNFRFDHDNFVAGDFDAVLDAIRGWEDAASHFICGATHEQHPAALARLRGLDVGAHGYWHHTYEHADDNRLNIERSIEVLRRAEIEPSGFVAPHGRFHAGLLTALERLGIGHSSEFALAYDELPFFPRGTDVLQIPVHPVSLGVILEAAHRQQPNTPSRAARQAVVAATEYFIAAACAKIAAGEPAFLYCHPDGRLGRYPEVLRAILAEVAAQPGVWHTTYTRFADWWRQRAAIVWRVHPASEGLTIEAEGLPRDRIAAVEVWRGASAATVSIHEATTAIVTESLKFEPRRRESAWPSGMPVVHRPSWKESLRRHIDWERVTPASELRVHSWRGLAKKTLRYIKG